MTLGSLDDPGAVKPVSTYGDEAKYPWLADIYARSGRVTEDAESLDGHPVSEIAETNHQHPDRDTVQWPPEVQRQR